ncbi:MAG: sulfatase-like hydrolase/transferase [Gemmatimonadetes bacterium]|nr:sulfatase-like hydrolase/transferase [Gemmatimonadota bacterium]
MLLAAHWFVNASLGPGLLAVEALLIVGVFALLPEAGWVRALAYACSAVVISGAVVDLGDVLAKQVLGRPLNLYLDFRLLDAVKNLLWGMAGPLATVLAGLVALGLVAALVTGVGRLLSTLGPTEPGLSARVTGLLLLIAFFTAGLAGGKVSALGQVVQTPLVRVLRDQGSLTRRTMEERARFEAELEGSTASYAAQPGLLRGLGGRDVVMAFVESYGMTVLTDARYRPVVMPRLAEMERSLTEAGLTLATGRLEAPSQGGQSWLGHGSVLSGLWLENQLRYDLLMASDRETLVDDFRAAGYRTAAVVPAITMAWPEGQRLGYDEVYDHEAIDYAGPALNWVTMPDQFTWSFLERRLRASAADSSPLFAEVSLISSHAPWTPILPVLEDWSRIGDGSVFEAWRDEGETPAELWRDHDRVREYYALSVDYALATATAYAQQFVGNNTLLMVLGDHQPAPMITGDDAPRTVPIHVIAGDPKIVEPFLDWGFTRGALPDPEGTVRRMDEFRDWFIHAYSRTDAK